MATDGKHGSLVRECPDSIRIGFKAFKYTRWFRCDVKDEPPTISFVQDVSDIRILARFRCGMSWLATEKNRHKGLGRNDRVCACCSAKEREDELHIFFCDAYAGLRAQFSEVFEDELYKRLHDAYRGVQKSSPVKSQYPMQIHWYPKWPVAGTPGIFGIPSEKIKRKIASKFTF